MLCIPEHTNCNVEDLENLGIIIIHTSTFLIFKNSYFFILNEKMRVAKSTFSFSF